MRFGPFNSGNTYTLPRPEGLPPIEITVSVETGGLLVRTAGTKYRAAYSFEGDLLLALATGVRIRINEAASLPIQREETGSAFLRFGATEIARQKVAGEEGGS